MLLKKRPKICAISYFDINGEQKSEEFGILKSRIFQHEYDHLNGYNILEDPNIIERKSIKTLEENEFELNRWIDEEKYKGFFC